MSQFAIRWSALLVAVLFILSISGAGAQADEIYDSAVAQCNIAYPSLVSDYLPRSSCIDEADRALSKRQDQLAIQEKEEAARPCIASELPEIEEKLEKLRASVAASPPIDIYDASDELIPRILNVSGTILVSDDDIFQRDIIAALRPKCDTIFYYLVNLRFDRVGELAYLAVFAKNVPKGFGETGSDGYVPEYSFDRLKSDEEQSVVTYALLRNQVHLEGISTDCLQDGCQGFRYTFKLTNHSNSTILDIGLGINWYVGQTGEPCPEISKHDSANYEVKSINLHPGESRLFEVYGGQAPVDGLPPGPRHPQGVMLCATIAGLKVP